MNPSTGQTNGRTGKKLRRVEGVFVYPVIAFIALCTICGLVALFSSRRTIEGSGGDEYIGYAALLSCVYATVLVIFFEVSTTKKAFVEWICGFFMAFCTFWALQELINMTAPVTKVTERTAVVRYVHENHFNRGMGIGNYTEATLYFADQPSHEFELKLTKNEIKHITGGVTCTVLTKQTGSGSTFIPKKRSDGSDGVIRIK
ncbi:MAG: hypothetical protein IJ710_06175 [Prevotella sp.]|nr:hypothetical protein [Prevotella sp.]